VSCLRGKTILVAGGSGLVGSHVLSQLLEIEGVKIRASFHARAPQICSHNITWVQADLTDYDSCCRLLDGVDYVCMCAAVIVRRGRDLRYLVPNLQMTLNMLEASLQAGVAKFLWFSSPMAYPELGRAVTEDEMSAGDPPDSSFAYGLTVRYLERMCEAFATKLQRKMTSIVLRPTTIYGEYGDFNIVSSHVFHALIRKVVERQQPLEVWGKGATVRDFIHASDVARAGLLALEKVEGFEIFNIGGGNFLSVRQLLDLILMVEGFRGAQVVFDASKPEPRPSVMVDCSKAYRQLGFKPRVTLEDGIKLTAQWLRAQTAP